MPFRGSLFDDCWHSAIEMCVGVPATLHAIYAMKTMGTKRLQMWGFLFVAGTCALIAALWTTLVQCSSDSCPAKEYCLFGLFLLFYFSVNWGPNMTTFVLPQELYPIQIRTTFNGIAAATGKLGAIAGIWLFEEVSKVFPQLSLHSSLTAVPTAHSSLAALLHSP